MCVCEIGGEAGEVPGVLQMRLPRMTWEKGMERLVDGGWQLEKWRYVFTCPFPPVISSIFGKSFPFPFSYFVLFVLCYFPFHVVYYNNHSGKPRNILIKQVLILAAFLHVKIFTHILILVIIRQMSRYYPWDVYNEVIISKKEKFIIYINPITR